VLAPPSKPPCPASTMITGSSFSKTLSETFWGLILKMLNEIKKEIKTKTNKIKSFFH
jgi:hypothetical protein